MAEESFRDKITTVDDKGRRHWLFPKKPKGRFYRYRTWVSYILLIFLFVAPWIKINSEPFILFNVVERKFVLFGQVFWPHDFYLFGLIMISLFVFVVLFTTVYGRIFCGWICPQTIFMEMVYRKIEYWIEGDFTAQKKLSQAPWGGKKISKRIFKYSIFYLIALGISHTFLSYIIGAEALLKIQTDPVEEHLTGFIAILIFSGVFFLVYAWFREQICLIVCPYGRLQGVMLDQNSLVVSYDHIRGEGKNGRERLSKGENRWKEVQQNEKGSCIDCKMCTLVCPTGIDIRNGTQLECINCTACIDACDQIMDRTGQPHGLVRFDSIAAIKTRSKKKFAMRSKAYTTVLLFLLGVIVFLFTLRGNIEATILRTPGVMYQQEGEYIVNLYNLRVLNKTQEDYNVVFKLVEPEGTIQMVGSSSVALKKGEETQQAFFIKILKANLKMRSQPVTIGIYRDNNLLRTYQTTFLGPEL